MQRRLERIGRDEVVVLEEIAAHLRHEEQDGREHREEDDRTGCILHGVIRVKRDAVERLAVGVLVLLDLDPVRVVRAHVMQREDVRGDQTNQHQGHGNDMQGEEPVQGRVRHHVIATDQDRQVRTDERHRAEQVHDHLCAPVGHLPPGEQVPEERLGHQAMVDDHAEDPDEFARLLVRTVQQRAEHVQVDHDEEHRRAGGVDVADQPAAGDVPHDVLDRAEREVRVGLVVHREEDAGNDLDDQHQHRHGAEVVPEVEVLRRVILGHVLPVLFPERGHALIDPVQHGSNRCRHGVTPPSCRRRSGSCFPTRTHTAGPAG